MNSERIRNRVVALVVVAGALWAAPSAGAATTVGQVAVEAEPTNCTPQTALVTTGISSGTSFVVPAGGGVITSWQTRAGSMSAGTNAKLKIYRTTMDPDQFLVVGQTGFQPITAGAVGGPSAVNGPFPARITVQAGDYVSILTGGNGGPCLSQTASAMDVSRVTQGAGDTATGMNTAFFPGSGNTMQRANVAAVLEGDADGDGFGDESQDNCLGVSGSQAGCPAPSGPGPQEPTAKHKKKKKCKKKGKHHSAATPSGGLAKKCKKK
jgi:hypothetical protein